jgi:hypothetical protein
MDVAGRQQRYGHQGKNDSFHTFLFYCFYPLDVINPKLVAKVQFFF